MIRVRFEIPYYITRDARPKVFYTKWPYWVCGRLPHAILMVAYAEDMKQLMEQWPYANILRCDKTEKIEFTARFYRPEWYSGRRNIVIKDGKIIRNGRKIYNQEEQEIDNEILKNGIEI